MSTMPLPAPLIDDRDLPGAARRGARPHPGPQPRVDQLQPQRPGRHADRAVRVPHREPALPRQPDPGAQPAQVPVAARRARCSRATSARGHRRVLANERGAARSDHARPPGSRCAPARCRSAPSRGLDVLPVEARAFYKRALTDPTARARDYYEQLYASYRGEQPRARRAQLYETVPLDAARPAGVDLLATRGRLALDRAAAAPGRRRPTTPAAARRAREALAGRTLSLGVVPVARRARAPARAAGAAAVRPRPQLHSRSRSCRRAGCLPRARPAGAAVPLARRRRGRRDVLAEPGIVQLDAAGRARAASCGTNLDPLEAGVGDFPPALEDTKLDARVHHLAAHPRRARRAGALLWAGINAATVDQRDARRRARCCRTAPASRTRSCGWPTRRSCPDLGHLTVGRRRGVDARSTTCSRRPRGARCPTRAAPGTRAARRARRGLRARPAAGEIRFGDGDRTGAARPRRDAARADYDYGVGRGRQRRARARSRRRRRCPRACTVRTRSAPGAAPSRDGRRGREAGRALPPAPRPAGDARGLRDDRAAHAGRRDRPRRSARRVQPGAGAASRATRRAR